MTVLALAPSGIPGHRARALNSMERCTRRRVSMLPSPTASRNTVKDRGGGIAAGAQNKLSTIIFLNGTAMADHAGLTANPTWIGFDAPVVILSIHLHCWRRRTIKKLCLSLKRGRIRCVDNRRSAWKGKEADSRSCAGQTRERMRSWTRSGSLPMQNSVTLNDACVVHRKPESARMDRPAPLRKKTGCRPSH